VDFFLNLWLARTKSKGAGQCPVEAFGLRVLSGVGICSNLHFHFILHTTLNSMVYINSKKYKNYLLHRLSSFLQYKTFHLN
jgi:hypothetical protein